MHAPITLLYGSLNLLLATLLGTAVSLVRLRDKKFVGAEVDGHLLRLVRAHGNNAEWTALGIVGLLLLELSGGLSLPLHLLGGLLLLTRVVHAVALVFRVPVGVANATVHYCVFAAMGAYALYLR